MRRRATIGLAALAAAAAAVVVPPIAHAAPNSATAPGAPGVPLVLAPGTGPFGATGDSSLLTVAIPAVAPEAPATGILPETDVDLAHTTAAAQSDGDLDPDQAGAQRSAAVAATTGDSSLLGAALDIQRNFASAPENEANEDILIPIPASPLLDVEVIETSAIANWVSDVECVAADTPMSFADQSLADANVISPAEGQSVVEVDVDTDDGAADTEAFTQLVPTGAPNDARAAQSVVTTRLAGANVLNGFDQAIPTVVQVDVVRAPSYTVTASGLPGGATVVGDDPIVDVSIGGQDVIRIEAGEIEEMPAIGLTLSDILDGLDPLLGQLEPIIRLSIPVERVEAPDGTFASVDASILLVEVLPPDPADLPIGPLADALQQLLDALGADVTQALATVELGPIAATAFAPAGGIICDAPQENPIELQKVNSGPAIPGSSFDYTIAVGNIGDCTLTNVRVVDNLTGPEGSTVELTEPTADVAPAAGGFTISWADVGPIEPNGRITLRIRVGVPENAQIGQRYTDRVTVTANCDGRDVTNTVEINEPAVEAPGQGGCDIRGSNKSASHTEVYPGEQFAYFINLFNSGGEDCTGVTVTDTLDSRVSFVSCSDDCTVDGRSLRWDLGTLSGGQSITLRIVVQVNDDATGNLPDTAIADTAQTPSHTMRTDGPLVTDRSVLAPNDPARKPTGVLARTGGSMSGTLLMAAGLGAIALAVRGLRRRTA